MTYFVRMKRMAARVSLFAVIVFVPAYAVAAVGWVAGTAPDKRPLAAPRIEQPVKAGGWQSQALRGVIKPHPEHILQFLDDQGSWFTPFTRAGMVGRYDLRGWHK